MPAIRVGSTRGVSRSFRSRSERTTLPPRQDLLVLFRQRRPARFTRNPTIPHDPHGPRSVRRHYRPQDSSILPAHRTTPSRPVRLAPSKRTLTTAVPPWTWFV